MDLLASPAKESELCTIPGISNISSVNTALYSGGADFGMSRRAISLQNNKNQSSPLDIIPSCLMEDNPFNFEEGCSDDDDGFGMLTKKKCDKQNDTLLKLQNLQIGDEYFASEETKEDRSPQIESKVTIGEKEDFWNNIENRILQFLKEHNVKPSSLEDIEHKETMSKRRKLTNMLETGSCHSGSNMSIKISAAALGGSFKGPTSPNLTKLSLGSSSRKLSSLLERRVSAMNASKPDPTTTIQQTPTFTYNNQ